MKNLIRMTFSVLALSLSVSGALRAEDVKAFLERIQSSDDQVRMAARFDAPKHGAAAIPGLAVLFSGSNREAATTSYHALAKIVHHVGRPGSDAAAKQAVCDALVPLVSDKNEDALRREALHWIALIGGAKEVAAAVTCIGDEGLQVEEAARLCLERLPVEAATEALKKAALFNEGRRRSDFLFSLGKKPASQSAKFLRGFVQDKDDEVRFAAVQALAHCGDRGSVALFAKILQSKDDPLRAKFWSEYQRLADNLGNPSTDADSRAIHELALKSAPVGFQRERSLQRLCPEGDAKGVSYLVSSLGDASIRVRDRALYLLDKLEGGNVFEELRDSYEEAKRDAKPALLSALARLEPEKSKLEVERSLESDDIELRVTALEISGKVDAEHEADFLAVARLVDSRVRAVALNAYLTRAESRLEAKDKKAALAMFAEGLKVAREVPEKRRAITGVIRVGDAAAIDLLIPFLNDPALSRDATTGYVGFASDMAKRGQVDEAERYLKTIISGAFPLDLVLQSAAVLKALGRDPQRETLAKGFVLSWWLIGAIRDEGKAMTESFFPEERVRFDVVERIGPRRYRWKKLQRLSLDGKVDLVPEFRRSQSVIAYAFTEIESKEEREIELRLGSDDGVVLWFNGEKIHTAIEGRRYVVDQDRIRVKLNKGSNKLLLKIGQSTDAWVFSLRTTDLAGNPINLSR